MKSKWIVVLCVAVFAAGVTAGVIGQWQYAVRNRDAARSARVAKAGADFKRMQEREAAKAWSPLPMPVEPAFGPPVAVPELPTLFIDGATPMVNGTFSPGSDTERQLQERFFLLVESLSDDDMRDLVETVRRGDLQVLFGPLPLTDFAVFRAWPTNGDLEDPKALLQPQIVINIAFFISTTQPDGLRVLSTVVAHEFDHYQVYRTADDETKRTFVPLLMSALAPRLSAAACARRWHTERRAYEFAALKAVAWGVRDDFSVRVSDPRALDQMVFMTLASNAGRTPECVAEWARLAGHPHPEAFRLDPR